MINCVIQYKRTIVSKQIAKIILFSYENSQNVSKLVIRLRNAHLVSEMLESQPCTRTALLLTVQTLLAIIVRTDTIRNS